MPRCVYVNGRYRIYDEALVSVEDRGFQFADSVYEVIEIRNSALIDLTRHLARLDRSLAELGIPHPMSNAALRHVVSEVARRNRVGDGIVYLQVSRGAGPRDFALPPAGRRPTFVCLARSQSRAAIEARATAGASVKTMPDMRWGRCDLKTVMLLPSVLAKASAKADGASEAWYVDEQGFITEGASSNAWIVDQSGTLVTRPTGHEILAGVTRSTLMDVAMLQQLKVVERPFTVKEALDAKEAFYTSASAIVMPVVQIDGHPVGDGTPGPLTRALRARFHDAAESVPF